MPPVVPVINLQTSQRESHRKNEPVVLGFDFQQQLEIARVYGSQNDLFEQLVRVRQQSGSRMNRFDIDSYSYHYGLFHKGLAIGTMTVTQASDGKLDCEQAYPSRLVHQFRDRISSPCKFRIQRGEFSSFRTLRTMLRHMWQDQLELGCRAMLINADLKLVSFYRRIGFDVLDKSEFVHPLLGTSSICMHLLVDPIRKSFFSDLFAKVSETIPRQNWMEFADSVGDECEIVESSELPAKRIQKMFISHPSSLQGTSR